MAWLDYNGSSIAYSGLSVFFLGLTIERRNWCLCTLGHLDYSLCPSLIYPTSDKSRWKQAHAYHHMLLSYLFQLNERICVGYAINHHADSVLLSLRKPGETGYKIPYGGLYKYISCPNYFGEMVEWFGFALAA